MSKPQKDANPKSTAKLERVAAEGEPANETRPKAANKQTTNNMSRRLHLEKALRFLWARNDSRKSF